MADIFELLNQRQAINRLKAAESLAQQERLNQKRKPPYRYYGFNADSGKAVIAPDGETPIDSGTVITNGTIKPGQQVRIAQDGNTITVNQMPRVKPKRSSPKVTPLDANIKTLYAIPKPNPDENLSNFVFEFWVGGWQPDSEKVPVEVPIDDFVTGVVDNLGGDDWRVNLCFKSGSEYVFQYLSASGIERETRRAIGTAAPPVCFGYEFWLADSTAGPQQYTDTGNIDSVTGDFDFYGDSDVSANGTATRTSTISDGAMIFNHFLYQGQIITTSQLSGQKLSQYGFYSQSVSSSGDGNNGPQTSRRENNNNSNNVNTSNTFPIGNYVYLPATPQLIAPSIESPHISSGSSSSTSVTVVNEVLDYGVVVSSSSSYTSNSQSISRSEDQVLERRLFKVGAAGDRSLGFEDFTTSSLTTTNTTTNGSNSSSMTVAQRQRHIGMFWAAAGENGQAGQMTLAATPFYQGQIVDAAANEMINTVLPQPNEDTRQGDFADFYYDSYLKFYDLQTDTYTTFNDVDLVPVREAEDSPTWYFPGHPDWVLFQQPQISTQPNIAVPDSDTIDVPVTRWSNDISLFEELKIPTYPPEQSLPEPYILGENQGTYTAIIAPILLSASYSD